MLSYYIEKIADIAVDTLSDIVLEINTICQWHRYEPKKTTGPTGCEAFLSLI